MKGIVLFISLCILYVCVEYCTAEEAPIVTTEHGPVRGIVATTVYRNYSYFAYYSVPYGKAKRFQVPEDPDPWTDIFDATKPGNVCIYYDYVEDTTIGTEDCLNLHVYIPKKAHEAGAALPVIVFIYGNAFIGESPNPKRYGPDFLVEHDVIMVAVAYRLGPLGFLALKHPEASGNAALEDQRLALLWVQKNIAKFGGDPKKVTLLGHSSGSVTVDCQVLSHKSKGLFQRAITQSGVSICPWALLPPDTAHDTAFRLASNLGYNGSSSPEELLAFLRNADVAEIVKESRLHFMKLFKPTVQSSSVISKEEAFLPDCPYKLLRSGNYNKVPRIIGYTKDEGLFTVGNGYETLTNHSLMSQLNAECGITKGINVIALLSMSKTITDVEFVAPIDLEQQIMSSNNDHEIYYYRYSLNSKYAWHRQYFDFPGAAHGDELPLIFQSMTYTPDSIDTPEGRTRRTLVELWTNFAKYGNPTPSDSISPWTNFTWEDSRVSGAMLDIDDTVQMTDRLPAKEISVFLAKESVEVIASALSGCTL